MKAMKILRYGINLVSNHDVLHAAVTKLNNGEANVMSVLPHQRHSPPSTYLLLIYPLYLQMRLSFWLHRSLHFSEQEFRSDVPVESCEIFRWRDIFKVVISTFSWLKLPKCLFIEISSWLNLYFAIYMFATETSSLKKIWCCF